eukprot:6194832-Pleurochrysis_carterae.AAC.2
MPIRCRPPPALAPWALIGLLLCFAGLVLGSKQVAVVKSPLTSALRRASPLVVALGHLPDTEPPIDLEILSTKCRLAGAAALVLKGSKHLSVFAAEQSTAISDFPGPVPLLCELDSQDLAADNDKLLIEKLGELQANGAAGITVNAGACNDVVQLEELIAAIGKLGAFLLPVSSSCAEC